MNLKSHLQTLEYVCMSSDHCSWGVWLKHLCVEDKPPMKFSDTLNRAVFMVKAALAFSFIIFQPVAQPHKAYMNIGK